MPRVNKRKSLMNDKIKYNFDVSILNTLILYTQCEFIDKSNLNRLKSLIENTDIDSYKMDLPIYNRLRILESILDSMVNRSMSNIDLIKAKLEEDFPPGVEVLEKEIPFEKNKLDVSECVNLTNSIYSKMNIINIYKEKDKLFDSFNKIDIASGFLNTNTEAIDDLKQSCSQILMTLNNKKDESGLMRSFSFTDDGSKDRLDNIVNKFKQPSNILITGIKQLNALLSPGFQAGRLYTILGGSGKFKSGTLLNIADHIRLFNKNNINMKNGLKKTILFVTLENSIEETIERLYDMYSDESSDIRSVDPEQVRETLEVEGNISFSANSMNNIDISFRYAGNLEINTAEIYAMVTDLTNRGYETICIIVDYIKRIDSAHPSNGDERVRMSYVAKELKSIAQYFQIPVITAMQLNRAGNNIIDSGMQEGKTDLARFVGSSSVGNAWDIIEDSDWVALINLELRKSTQQLYLTFKRLKIRGKKVSPVEYFNHPFVNSKNIRLAPDIDLDTSLSIISLSTDLESFNENENDAIGINDNRIGAIRDAREDKKKIKHKSADSIVKELRGVKSIY